MDNDVIEDWRVVTLARPHGFVVAVVYDDGVEIVASVQLDGDPLA